MCSSSSSEVSCFTRTYLLSSQIKTFVVGSLACHELCNSTHVIQYTDADERQLGNFCCFVAYA